MGVAEVVQQCPFKQFDVLGKVHDRTPSGFGIVGHVAVVQPDATGIGCTVDAGEQFGEGGFDKGIFFNIPIFNNFVNYTWKPLTKDPGAKLNRQNTLYDLLVRFRPTN